MPFRLGVLTIGEEQWEVTFSEQLARFTRILCTQQINDPDSLEAFLACTLIPLDKNPGLRPIGIGEVIRRIIGKVVMICLKNDIINTNGNLQLCAGIRSGRVKNINDNTFQKLCNNG